MSTIRPADDGAGTGGGTGGPPCGAPAAHGDPPDPAAVPDELLPTALLGALRRFGPSWVRWLRANVGDPRLSPERMHLVGALGQAGRPLIMREITTRLGTTPRAVTALVDGLESDGLVQRSAHPSDRRAVLVELSPAGRELLHGAASGFAASATVFQVLAPDEQRTLLALLDRLTAALADRASDHPADGSGEAVGRTG